MPGMALVFFALVVGVFGTQATQTRPSSCKTTVFSTVHSTVTSTVSVLPSPYPTSALHKSITSCQSSSTTLSSLVATPTPYNYQLFSGYAWPSDCLLMQFCNGANFGGECIVAYENVSSYGEGYCINLPYPGVDQSYGAFSKYYGNFSTLSYRARPDLRCSTFFMPNCSVPTNVTFSGSGIANAAAEGYSTFFSSFQCYPADEAEPNWLGSATTTSTATTVITTFYPSLSSTLTATTIDVAPAAVSSVAAALRNYFDPLVDDILICGTSNASQCASGEFGANCIGGYQLSNLYGIDQVRVAAAGFGKQCVIYNTSNCEAGSITIRGAQPTTLASALSFGSLFFKCWNTLCAVPTNMAASSIYSTCTSSLPGLSGMYTISPIPVMTIASSISFIGTSSTLPLMRPSSTPSTTAPVDTALPSSTPSTETSPTSVRSSAPTAAPTMAGMMMCTSSTTNDRGSRSFTTRACPS